MAAATIPELIQPGSLYVPSPNNTFTVASGVLPNGDDALEVPNTTTDYRAYQPAIDGIHYHSDASDPITIAFWTQALSGTTGGSATNTFQPTTTIMGVMDVNTATSAATSTGATDGFAWGLSFQGVGGANDNNSRRYTYSRSVATTGSAGRRRTSQTTVDAVTTWAFVGLNDIPGTGFEWYRDGTAATGASESPGTPGTPATLVDPYFALGAYSTVSGWGVSNVDRYFAKFSIWDRPLTAQEWSDLYDSMMSGPPSP